MKHKMTAAQQELAASNLRLVQFVLSKMGLCHDEDAYGAGCLGLCKAAARWREGGLAFSTFAYHLIRHEIINYLSQKRSAAGDTTLEDLENILRTYERGYEAVENRDLLQRIFSGGGMGFSPDEQAVVRMLAAGRSIESIASSLGVCTATVYIIRKSALKKLKT